MGQAAQRTVEQSSTGCCVPPLSEAHAQRARTRNSRQLAESQHGILLSARRRGQKRAGRKDGKDEKDLLDEKLISFDVLGVFFVLRVLSCRGGIRISKALFRREEEYRWTCGLSSIRAVGPGSGGFGALPRPEVLCFEGFGVSGERRVNREGVGSGVEPDGSGVPWGIGPVEIDRGSRSDQEMVAKQARIQEVDKLSTAANSPQSLASSRITSAAFSLIM